MCLVKDRIDVLKERVGTNDPREIARQVQLLSQNEITKLQRQKSRRRRQTAATIATTGALFLGKQALGAALGGIPIPNLPFGSTPVPEMPEGFEEI